MRGLCYAIRAYGWTHADSSTLEVASGLDSTKCLEAYGRIKEIVRELESDGPTEEEVERARAYAAGPPATRSPTAMSRRPRTRSRPSTR